MKNGWQKKRLGELLQKTETINPLQSPNAEFDYIDVSGVSNKTFEIEGIQRLKGADAPSRARRLVKANDVLFATVRPTLQRIAIVPQHLDNQICSTGYFVLRPREGLNHRFLFYSLFTDSFLGEMEERQKGASYPAVSDGDVRAQEIPVPPLPDQRRIVGILDEAFAAIASAKAYAEKNLQNASALFQSCLQTVFAQRGDGWIETTLGAEADLLTGFPFKSTGYTAAASGVWLLRGDNIIQGSLRWHDAKRWPARDIRQYERFRLSAGDVVLAMDRPWVSAGMKRASISHHDLPCFLVQRTARLRGNGRLNSRFLFHLTGCNAFARHILGAQTGIGVPHVSGAQIQSFRFLKPPPNEQAYLSGRLDVISAETKRLESNYYRKAALLAELKRSLLHQAFSGQL